MKNEAKQFATTQYAVDLISQGYSVEEVQQIMKQNGVLPPTLTGTLNELIGKKGLTVEMVAGLAEIDPATIYRFMNRQRNPSRNALLRIAFAMTLSLEETQVLLKSGNCAALSGSRERDLLIMDGIIQKRYFDEVNENLTKHALPDLNGRG